MSLEKQRLAVARLEKRVRAMRGKTGVEFHRGQLQAAKHALMRMENEARRTT